MARLQDRVAIVTGATSGIGEGIARRFAQEGAHVLIVGRDVERGAHIAAETGGRFVACDVTREADLAAVVELAIREHGRLDSFVNNAGAPGVQGRITDIDEAGFDATVALLLKAVAFGMKHACRAMRDAGGGSIVSTSSSAALLGGCGPHVYSACKAGIIGLTRSVAFEEGAHGIRVNCICAGGVETPIVTRTLGLEGDSEKTRMVNEAVAATVSASTALGRVGYPADIAGAAAWLASDDAAYVTGQAIVVDGGQTIGKVLGGLPVPVRPHGGSGQITQDAFVAARVQD